MTGNFLFIEQGARLSLRPPTDKANVVPLIRPPRFFFSTIEASSMDVLPKYRNVPFLQEKLTHLKKLIKGDRDTIASWEASEPDYPLLYKVKEQLAKNSQMLKEITGGVL